MIRDLDAYQALAMRTDGTQNASDRLLNAALGMAGEAGEVIEHVKKHLFHGHPLDTARLEKEIGDLLWYVAQGSEAIGSNLSAVASHNIEKLRLRYPDKFSSAASLGRPSDD